jgi:hypothetical protein
LGARAVGIEEPRARCNARLATGVRSPPVARRGCFSARSLARFEPASGEDTKHYAVRQDLTIGTASTSGYAVCSSVERLFFEPVGSRIHRQEFIVACSPLSSADSQTSLSKRHRLLGPWLLFFSALNASNASHHQWCIRSGKPLKAGAGAEIRTNLWYRYLNDIRHLTADNPETAFLVEQMIARKRALFADDRRLIGNWDVTRTEDGINLHADARDPHSLPRNPTDQH